MSIPMIPRSLILIFLLLTLIPNANAAMIHYFEFGQLTFDQMDPETIIVENSDIGRVSLAYEVGPVTEYLNMHAIIPGLSTEPFWIVRNLYLHDDLEGPPYEEINANFPLSELGVESGFPVGMIQYGYTLTPEPILDVHYPDWAITTPLINDAVVQPEVSSIPIRGPFSLEMPTGALQPEGYYTPRYIFADTTIAKILGCLVGNVELDSGTDANDKNGCVPAACANSLDWMNRTDDNINFPGDLRSTYEELSKLMGRTGPKGVWQDVMVRAKLDFIEAHNLPIEVKYQDRWPRGSSYGSTSGNSSASNKGAAGQYPTKEWLKSEMKNGEDVEVNVTYYYTQNDTLKQYGSHCVVVSGSGRTAGANWVYVKHDDDQSTGNPSGRKQEYSDIITNGWGAMELPGLGRRVVVAPGDTVTLRPVVNSVISESYKAEVTGPPATESPAAYCDWFARTIPANGSLELGFPPLGEGRCYNATVWRMDHLSTPPSVVQECQWNINAGSVRVWRNPHDYPVTVFVHNDDKSPGSFDINVNVNPAVVNPSTPGNPEVYAGFSLGGHDGQSNEFSQEEMGPVVMTSPIGPGFHLSEIPSHLAEVGGTQELRLMMDMVGWNIYWENMGFVLDVLAVNAPGELMVDCPSTGMMDIINISEPGRYELELGMAAPNPQFELNLTSVNGLDFILDSLGVPSLVPLQDTSPAGEMPTPTQLDAWPNPFNPSVTLTFRLQETCKVSLKVFDLRGRHIATLADAKFIEGEHQKVWHGVNDAGQTMSSGTYLIKLKAGDKELEKRVTLVK